MTINKKSKSSQKKVLVKKKVINFTRLFDQDKDYGYLIKNKQMTENSESESLEKQIVAEKELYYNPIKQPTLDNSIDKGIVFIVVVFSISMILAIIYLLNY